MLSIAENLEYAQVLFGVVPESSSTRYAVTAIRWNAVGVTRGGAVIHHSSSNRWVYGEIGQVQYCW